MLGSQMLVLGILRQRGRLGGRDETIQGARGKGRGGDPRGEGAAAAVAAALAQRRRLRGAAIAQLADALPPTRFFDVLAAADARPTAAESAVLARRSVARTAARGLRAVVGKLTAEEAGRGAYRRNAHHGGDYCNVAGR